MLGEPLRSLTGAAAARFIIAPNVEWLPLEHLMLRAGRYAKLVWRRKISRHLIILLEIPQSRLN